MLTGLNVTEREERVKDYILPAKIIASEGDIESIEKLLTAKPLQIAVREAEVTTVKEKSFIVLDFGKEISGGVRILTHVAETPCKVRLRFGESLSETYAELKGAAPGATATNDHSTRDFTVDLAALSDMQFGSTGFRFLRIDFLSGFAVRIKSIVGVFEHLDLERRGSFTCSDPLVNQIFETSAYTVGLCMQGMIWDGVKRDRLVWSGDLHPETLSIFSLFGAHKSVEKSLEFEKNATPLPAFMDNMATYSLWWLCVLSEYYLYSADLAFVRRHRDYIVDLTKTIDALVDKNGALNIGEGAEGFFLDWQTFSRPERKAGVYALYDYAMEKTKLLLRALDCDISLVAGIQKRLKKDSDGGAFKQVNAFQALAGHVPFDTAAGRLLAGGARGISTFMSYYILSALSEAGKTRDALSLMKEYYGAMLSRGATTFWEDFDIEWLNGTNSIDRLSAPGEKDIHGDFGAHCYTGYRHSLCHGWASGPVPYLMRYVLGVTVLEPGCAAVAVSPDLGGLTYACGTFPTPHGPIQIEHRHVNGKTESKITAPAAVTVITDKP